MYRIKNYLSQWSIMRILRLVMGIVITIQGIKSGQWIITGLGIMFTALPLFNMGCGANGSCEVPPRRREQ
ncbi:hypothetical protein ACP6L2_07595 [Sphingobacterium lactis]|uniref:hypothetical protein n=1 Tax=Sphingobacterium lactis TaxID=797291 RepID=UPI003F7E54F4